MNFFNPKVDPYFVEGCGRCPLGGTPQCNVNKWPEELQRVRKLVLDCGLKEELKWSVPCYTFEKSNVVILGAFKESCTISFLKGALLHDPDGVLEKPGENTQSARVIRFCSVRDVKAREPLLRAFILQSIENEKQGLKIDFKAKSELVIPEELEAKFAELPRLRSAFESLTPGRQRGYILHFTSAKQAKTRTSRIDKCVPSILEGRGFNE